MATDVMQIDPIHLNESERNEYLQIMEIMRNLNYNAGDANYSSVNFEYHNLVKRALMLNNKNHMLGNEKEMKALEEKSQKELEDLPWMRWINSLKPDDSMRG